MRNQIISVGCLFLLVCCNPQKKITNGASNSISPLRFFAEYDVPNGEQFQGTTIGGLSGIDYDPKNDIYYLISDDRSAINPARFYTAKIRIKENRIDTVEFIDVRTFHQQNG